MKTPSKFVVLSHLPDDVYMTDKRGYIFVADRIGEPENAQQLCQLLNKAFRAERARVRRLVRKLRDQYDGDFQAYCTACNDILATLKEGR